MANGIYSTPAPRRIWRALAMALFALLASVAMAQSSAKFSLGKVACLGNPATMTDPSICAPADTVATGTAGYYMITLTNPWSQPQQTINVTDAIPPQFTPTVGAIFCRDDNNVAVTWTPSNSAFLMSVPLGVGQTVHCYIGGTFNGGGTAVTATNVATGNNSVSAPISDDAKTTVLPTSQLGVNLALTKSASPAAINLTSGAQTVTYTITITNQGSVPVTLGQWFQLHDNFALLPGSVPLNASIQNAQCSATAGSDCLDSGGPQFDGQWTGFVGTMNSHHAFDWGFANTADSIAAGGVLTITFEVKFSAVSGVNCVTSAAAINGLKNTAFFTLTNKASGTAATDLNPADNSASVNVAATVPYSEEYPDCAAGQLKVSKTQLSPANPVTWGSTVNYEIRIKNVSVPAQTITVQKTDLQDYVQEGINTPPFDRKHASSYCDAAASSPGVCAPFGSGGLNLAPNHHYSYYLEMDKGWDNAQKLKLNFGQEAVFRTSFVYYNPDCETVPNTPKRPIINHVRVTYKAQPYGSPSGTPAVTMSQSAKAETLMKPQPPCKFKVTKTTANTSGKLQFGQSINYTVQFTNQGSARTIGTVMDAVRISIPNYASMLPFSASWNCTGLGPPIVGSLTSGMATYVPSPAQGAPAAMLNLGSNVFFPSGGVLTCNISMKVKRPPLNDTFCTRDDAYFENVALMDVTAPFNNNIFWPPSGAYLSPPVLSNPNPQNRNWASVRLMLPKCWDAHIQKTARVDNLPAGTQPWTYFGNTADVHFDIFVTNDADSPLGDNTPLGPNTPAGGAWIVQDKFASSSPYNSGQLTLPLCTPPANWAYCSTGGQIAVKNLAAHVQGKWTSTLNHNFVQNGQDIRNCAWLYPQNAAASLDWYNRQLTTIPSYGCYPLGSNQPSAACAGANNGPLVSCAYVPVLQITKITVNKLIVDQTGAGVTSAPGYVVNVGCTPYAIPTTVPSSLTLSAGGAPGVVSVVPMGSTCSVTETVKPIPLAISAKCGGAVNVLQSTAITPLPATLDPVNNLVTVTNTYDCQGAVPTGQIEVIKVLNTIAHPIQFPATTWAIDSNCAPGGSISITTPISGNSQITASYPSSANQAPIAGPVGTNCTVSETAPSNSLIPVWFQNWCALPAQGSGTAVWNTPEYSVNNGPYLTTAPSVQITTGVTTVRVKNGWHCVPTTTPTANFQFQIFKKVTGPTLQVPPMTFQISADCTSPSTPAAVSITTASTGGGGAITVPAGSSCSFSEVMPDPKLVPAMVAYCSAQAPNIEPKWLPPVWSNSGTGTPAMNLPVTANASQNVFVTNTWVCGPPAAAKVKPKPKRPRIKVNIGIGSIFGGGGGKPKDAPSDPRQDPPRPR